MAPEIRILVADEHDIFRVGVRVALEYCPDMVIVAEANDEETLLQQAHETKPDVILMDIGIPIRGGVNGFLNLRQAIPNAKIIVFSYQYDRTLVNGFLRAGANGYLSKEIEASVMVQAIRTVHKKGYFFDREANRSLQESLLRPITVVTARPRSSLTEKEVAVLRLICMEHSTRDIATSLSLSPRTIESIRDKIRAKTGSRNLAGMALYALKNGLIRLE